jgi:hypothetical protein
MTAYESGDIILFGASSCISRLIQCCSFSSYSHVGVVLENPHYLPNVPDVSGSFYVIQSSDNTLTNVVSQTAVSGVQIVKLSDILVEYQNNIIFHRHLNCVRDQNFYDSLEAVCKEVLNKPYDYDLFDWIRGKMMVDNETVEDADQAAAFAESCNCSCWSNMTNFHQLSQKTDEFVCSSLATYIYVKIGVILPSTDWTLVAPKDFANPMGFPVEKSVLKFSKNCYLT